MTLQSTTFLFRAQHFSSAHNISLQHQYLSLIHNIYSAQYFSCAHKWIRSDFVHVTVCDTSLYSRETQVFGNIMFSSVTQPPRGPPPPPSPPSPSSPSSPPSPPSPPCYNFVSAIIFEGFKLRSSNFTHALLIQISRTSSIIDIVVPSKMAAGGHFVKNKSCVSI